MTGSRHELVACHSPSAAPVFGQLEQVMNAKELKVFLKSVARLTPARTEGQVLSIKSLLNFIILKAY